MFLWKRATGLSAAKAKLGLKFAYAANLRRQCNLEKSHMKHLALAFLLSLLLNGCANESGARMGFASATSPVLAILSDDLFTGEAVGYMDRTGTIEITSVIDPNLKCVGQFQYTGSKTGTAIVRCNDGAIAELSFNGLSMLSGYGYGRSSR